MEPQPAEYDYAARFPGMPGYGAIAADDPDPKWRKELSKTIADWVRRGATVERVTRAQACAGMREYMDAMTDQRHKTAADSQQLSLL